MTHIMKHSMKSEANLKEAEKKNIALTTRLQDIVQFAQVNNIYLPYWGTAMESTQDSSIHLTFFYFSIYLLLSINDQPSDPLE